MNPPTALFLSHAGMRIVASTAFAVGVLLSLSTSCGPDASDSVPEPKAEASTSADAQRSEPGSEGSPSGSKTDAGSCDCPPGHPCMPNGECDCDRDGDGVAAEACDGMDADDNDKARYPGNKEVCGDVANTLDVIESDTHDEDQDPQTIGTRDRDGDGEIDAACKNIDPKTGEIHQGEDCDDDDKDRSSKHEEICDGKDNDCDGLIDEGEDGTEYGQQRMYALDDDGDGYPSDDSTQHLRACPYRQPVAFVPLHPKTKLDTDDGNRDKHPDAEEICDGEDNDGNKLTDGEDPGFRDYREFTGTDVVCENGRPKLLCPPGKAWCPDAITCPDDAEWCDAKLVRGCDVDATTLSNCGGCRNRCQFSCGEGCDEIAQVSIGLDYVCVATQQGRASCWGRNHFGQVGNDSLRITTTPESVVQSEQVRKIAAGLNTTCAVMTELEQLYCWGNNEHSLLGLEAILPSNSSPNPVTAGEAIFLGLEAFTGIKDVDVSSEHACAIHESGTLFCWGSQAAGRLGNLSEEERMVTAPRLAYHEDYSLVEDAQQLALGEAHGCILTTGGGVSCWGDNSLGQLGVDPEELSQSSHVRAVEGLEDVTRIAAGEFFTCALSEGRVHCWGYGGRAGMGRAEASDLPEFQPTPIEGVAKATGLAAGDSHACAIVAEQVWCWGANDFGQLGRPLESPATAAPVVGLADVVGLSAGGINSCARLANDELHCWGSNRYGQLGVGPDFTQVSASPSKARPLAGSKP